MKLCSCFINVAVLACILLGSCRRIDPAIIQSQYPKEVGNIINTQCAVAGCHNNASYQNAANLNLTTWQTMFQGGVNGAVAIPFSVEHSSLLQFVNTFDDLGNKAVPTMPINATSLTREQVLTLKNWIANGCPNSEGRVPFAEGYSSRKKIYIANQGCDVVSILDAETGLVMRKIQVGKDPATIEAPHCLRVSPDGKYWYVCFTNSPWVQKFSTANNMLAGEVNIGQGSWNILDIAKDGNTAMLSDFSDNGKLVQINLNTMQIKQTIAGSGLFTKPHGIAHSLSGDTIFITAQFGNTIYRYIPSLAQIDNLSLQKGMPAVTTPLLLDPHEIKNINNTYFITCQASNEVRVWQGGADTLAATIPVGVYPLEMAYSAKRKLLFVTCQEDINITYPSFIGTVYVIDVASKQVVRVLREKFYQPHGISVDDVHDKLVVVSRNANPNGPAPHHAASCAGRNGYYTTIDLNTWQVVVSSHELSVDPYTTDVN